MNTPSSRKALVIVLLTSTLVVSGASDLIADEAAATKKAGWQSGWTAGARIGGYGFREPTGGETRRSGWEDCRMNGLGLFAERAFGKTFYAEAGLDVYFAESWPLRPSGDPMDRVSGLLSVAGGMRFFPKFFISPYLQIGGGLEVTHVAVDAIGAEGTFALPMGFVGFGTDVKIGRHFRGGATLRTLVMGHFDHDRPAGEVKTTSPDLRATPELVAQLQFYAKYAF